ncbi:MAG TPA: hypothetical protein VFV01_08020 [Spirillospora sp.]|nr:hypothetical protein [Spirillospora sp.]
MVSIVQEPHLPRARPRPNGTRSSSRRTGRSTFPWLALLGVVATITAATTLILGIGHTLKAPDDPRGRLLPLQAASPTAKTSPPAPSGSLSSMPTPPPGSAPIAPPRPPAGRAPAPAPDPTPSVSVSLSVHQVLLQFRRAVDQGVGAGDVRPDVGVDFNNLIKGMLTRPRAGDADITELRDKLATRTREGAISPRRAERLGLILDRAAT